MKNLRDVVAAGAHVTRAPHDQGDAFRVGARPLEVALQECLGRGTAGAPGGLRGNGADVAGVKVTPGWQDVRAAAGRRTTGARGNKSAAESTQDVVDFLVAKLQKSTTS